MIFKILEGSNNLNLLFLNFQRYAEKVVEIIKEHEESFEVEGIKYINLGEGYSTGLLRKEIPSYSRRVVKVQKSIYDGIIKESNIEEEFAKALDKDSRIKLFIKLPDEYKEPLILQIMWGFSGHEIAAELDLKLATVNTRLFRARKQLKQMMNNEITEFELQTNKGAN